jgi:chitodextrinase
MIKTHVPRLAARAAAITLVMALGLAALASPASAARDRTPPTRPTNLRVTGTTPYSVSLAWNPSSDNSGSFSYRICCAGPNSAAVSQAATSFTFTAGVEAGRTYTFRISAVDGSGNSSGYSNSVTVKTPADTITPTQPVVSVTDVGPTHVSLAWSSVEDGPYVWFWVYRDGAPVLSGTRDTSGTIRLLQPGSTYTFTVLARDFAMHYSPLSEPLVVTTDPANPADVTGPTTPGNLSEDHFGDGEVHLSWIQSTDDFTPQTLIRYDVYVNGVLDHSTAGIGSAIVYGVPGSNTFTVVAVDEAGNESAPATVTVDLDL